MGNNLTKEEIKNILDAMIVNLRSLYYPKSYKGRDREDFENDNYDEVLKYPYECFGEGIDKEEFEVIKSVIRKLKNGKIWRFIWKLCND